LIQSIAKAYWKKEGKATAALVDGPAALHVKTLYKKANAESSFQKGD
jgi:hypothetical protein